MAFCLPVSCYSQFTEQTLYSFGAKTNDGKNPYGTLVQGRGNALYGTTELGGTNTGAFGGSGSGTVFKLNTDGSRYEVICSFRDSGHPLAGVVQASDGALYGTTAIGGTGDGSVFKVETDGSGYTQLHFFNQFYFFANGYRPQSALMQANNGALYGTTTIGGSGGSFSLHGTAFELHTDGSGFGIVHHFGDFVGDGATPACGLMQGRDGAIYGTTHYGGANGSGTIFKMNADGSGYAVLHSFGGIGDGQLPVAAVVQGSDGAIYGTTPQGGAYGYGSAFKLNTDGSAYAVLHSFGGYGDDGQSPQAALLRGADGALYGTTSAGGTNGFGTAFKLNTDGSAYAEIYSFGAQAGDGHHPYAGLIQGLDGALYGAAEDGGAYGYGSVFRLTAIQHVVVVMMENRSFDHFLGWLPGAAGRQNWTYTNASGQAFRTWHLDPNFQGCDCHLPDQAFGATNQYNNGACDGWLIANPSDTYSIGFYLQNDLAFLGQAAKNWTVCDHYYAALMAETQPNRIYQHAAQTDWLTNRTGSEALSAANDLLGRSSPYRVTLPTIWDRLASNSLTGRYYSELRPTLDSVLTLWGVSKYYGITFLIDQFYTDCSNGTLPAVSFVDPTFTSVLDGLNLGDTGGDDDHPHSDIRNGEAFLARIYNAIVSSPNWASTVLIINFDEWGGFFDHVQPPKLPAVQIPPAEAALGNDGRLGFRVPCLVISPWSRGPKISSEQFDHTSVLKLIENRWGLAPLTVRDANANDLADVLDFDHPNFTPPPVVTNVPMGPFGGPCQTVQIVRQADGSILVSWDATCRKVQLQSSSDPVKGPWNDIATITTSPYVLKPAGQQLFFRAVLTK